MAEIIIDANEAIFGRLCSYAAKQALEGNDVIIVNCENAIISGNKKDIIKKHQILKAKGGFSQKGPRYSKIAYKILKRGIRGMLPDHRKGIGRIAFKRVICYDKIPEELRNKKMIKMKKIKHDKYIKLEELCNKL